MREALLVGRNPGYPVGICVVGIAGVLEDGGCAGREGEPLRHLHVADVDNLQTVILTAPEDREDE